MSYGQEYVNIVYYTIRKLTNLEFYMFHPKKVLINEESILKI